MFKNKKVCECRRCKDIRKLRWGNIRDGAIYVTVMASTLVFYIYIPGPY